MFLYSYIKEYRLTFSRFLCLSLLSGCSVAMPESPYYTRLGTEDASPQSQYYKQYAPQYKQQGRNVQVQKAVHIPSQSSFASQQAAYSRQQGLKKIPAHYKPYVVFGKEYYPLADAEGYSETGVASWYGSKFHGKKTSNGEIYDMYAETAAHKTLPMGSIVRVTNLENGRSTVVRINDRGPFVGDRIIDLSKAVASRLDIIEKGTGLVKIEVVEAPPPLQARLQGAYYLQVGAYADKGRAYSILSSIESRGLPTRLIATENKKVWKVQIGPMKKLAETTRTKELLTSDFPESYIVME